MTAQRAVEILAAAERDGNRRAGRLLRTLAGANERPSSDDYAEVVLDCVEYAELLAR